MMPVITIIFAAFTATAGVAFGLFFGFTGHEITKRPRAIYRISKERNLTFNYVWKISKGVSTNQLVREVHDIIRNKNEEFHKNIKLIERK